MNDKTSVPDRLPPIQLPPPLVQYYAPTVPANEQPKSPNIMKRKSSHSAIEKKRREKMNDKIEKLKTLIPSCTAQFPVSVQQPIHKLSVLQAAVDYIEELHKKLEINLPEDDPLRKDLSIVLQKKTT